MLFLSLPHATSYDKMNLTFMAWKKNNHLVATQEGNTGIHTGSLCKIQELTILCMLGIFS